jgi:ribonucleoside-triphosphate reductase (formate)
MDNTTAVALNKTKSCLEEALAKKYKVKEDKNITVDKFLDMHGLNKNNFDFSKAAEMVINERLNDVSIDANSNKNGKTIEGIIQEAVAPIKKCLGIVYLYESMKILFGKEEANRLMGEVLDYSLGLSDTTALLKIYCYAFDATKLVTEGRQFGQLYSKPCKRIQSYISSLGETIHQLSSHLAGAIAIGSFFLDIAHLTLYGDALDLRELKTSKNIRDIITNEYQQFIHTVNHLSRNGIESPFTNISVFDRPKLRSFVKEYSWYFPFDKLPIHIPKFDDNEEEKSDYCVNYIVDYIIELQDIFLDFFDKGDPSKNGMPLRFPIVTINLSKKLWGDKLVIADDKFLKSVCRRDIFRYNIYVSEGNKISSCCRLLSDKEMLDLAGQSNSFGGTGLSLGSHRVCTININRIMLEAKDKEDFYRIFLERIESTAKILKAHKELIIQLEKKNLQMFITNGWINMKRLFSTFGMLGIYEAAKAYKERFGGKDPESEILKFMNEKVLEMSKKYEICGNLEQIPGESFCIRLAKADRLLFGEKKVPYHLYSNQFIPLWEDTTIWEKMEKEGRYNKLITGGSICHIQVADKVTAKQAENIIKYAIAANCEFFALNSVYQICEDNHVTMGKDEKCPVCQKPIKDYYSRVVGFFTPISSWQKERKEFDFPNRKFIDIKELDKD